MSLGYVVRPKADRDIDEVADDLAFYEVVGDQVEVIRVLHGARDLERALFED